MNYFLNFHPVRKWYSYEIIGVCGKDFSDDDFNFKNYTYRNKTFVGGNVILISFKKHVTFAYILFYTLYIFFVCICFIKAKSLDWLLSHTLQKGPYIKTKIEKIIFSYPLYTNFKLLKWCVKSHLQKSNHIFKQNIYRDIKD